MNGLAGLQHRVLGFDIGWVTDAQAGLLAKKVKRARLAVELHQLGQSVWIGKKASKPTLARTRLSGSRGLHGGVWLAGKVVKNARCAVLCPIKGWCPAGRA